MEHGEGTEKGGEQILTEPPLNRIEAKVDRTAISIHGLHDPPDDLEYWLSRTPAERLAATELLRQINYGYDPVNDRMEKVIEVVNLGDE